MKQSTKFYWNLNLRGKQEVCLRFVDMRFSTTVAYELHCTVDTLCTAIQNKPDSICRPDNQGPTAQEFQVKNLLSHYSTKRLFLSWPSLIAFCA